MIMRFELKLTKHQAHMLVFVGICTACILDRYFGARDAALLVSIFSNSLWIFHG